VIIFIDGLRRSDLPATDSTIVRGDGVFEAIRSYGGRLFALEEHLERLARSAGSMEIPLPEDNRIAGWASSVAAEGGEGIVRIIVSRGDAVPGQSEGPRVIVMHHPVPYATLSIRLLPVPAPWHPAGRPWELSGVKSISYAPNLAATRVARKQRFGDALLIADDGTVLEGPTFSVAWLTDGVMHTPDLDLGILDAITRRHVLALAERFDIEVRTGRYPLEALQAADEAFAMSTVMEVTPVISVGATELRTGQTTERLMADLKRAIADSISGH
jgi:branched-subunit amino acid aminotransferase/4-amino-4-deoxychorismate lyase